MQHLLQSKRPLSQNMSLWKHICASVVGGEEEIKKERGLKITKVKNSLHRHNPLVGVGIQAMLLRNKSYSHANLCSASMVYQQKWQEKRNQSTAFTEG